MPCWAHGQAAKLPPELTAARDALARYQDPIVAVRDGYFSTLACVEYPDGGMGVHFLNMATLGPTVDPSKPNVLIYQPVGNKLRLAAAEWFVPLASGVKERPQIFGQPFDGPMAGHEPVQPAELHHYDLHVWLWKSNPAGVFHSTNPDLKCPEKEPYTLSMSEPEAVPHH
ncbi:MAG: hypothetical protein H0V09_10435 [Gemmatimonadetes bacterium]|nr:hypothetical protein [Gemmatimonadota bacterium]